MRFIISNEEKYTKVIFEHLLKYNKSKLGSRQYYGKSFYLVQDDTLLAGANTFLSWDWIDINEIYYQNKEQLKQLLTSIYSAYGDHFVGVKFDSNIKPIADDLIDIGFKLIETIKFSPLMTDYFFLEMKNLVTEVDCKDVLVSDNQIETYNKEIIDTFSRFKKEYKVKDTDSELCISLYDKEKFIGGIVGGLYEDHAYIDMLVVKDKYRGKEYGKRIVERFHQELPSSIVTISLGTTQFQAKGFYEKLGYKTVVTHNNKPKGFNSYTMIKNR